MFKQQDTSWQQMLIKTLQRDEVLSTAHTDSKDAASYDRLILTRQIELVKSLLVQARTNPSRLAAF